MSSPKIRALSALQIADSRGNPTVDVDARAERLRQWLADTGDNFTLPAD